MDVTMDFAKGKLEYDFFKAMRNTLGYQVAQSLIRGEYGLIEEIDVNVKPKIGVTGTIMYLVTLSPEKAFRAFKIFKNTPEKMIDSYKTYKKTAGRENSVFHPTDLTEIGQNLSFVEKCNKELILDPNNMQYLIDTDLLKLEAFLDPDAVKDGLNMMRNFMPEDVNFMDGEGVIATTLKNEPWLKSAAGFSKDVFGFVEGAIEGRFDPDSINYIEGLKKIAGEEGILDLMGQYSQSFE